MRSTKHLWSDERGATAVEVAILSPALMLFLIGILEFAMMFFTQQVMENVSYNISRLGKTGYTEAGLTQQQTIMAMLTERLPGFVNIDDVTIQTSTYSEFSDIADSEPYVDANSNGVRDDGENFTDTNGNGEYDGALTIEGYGQSGDITVYQITVPWRVMTPVFSELVGNEGNMELHARVVVRNEPYAEDEGV